MKTFIIEYQTNYGVEVQIINAFDEVQAKSIAENNGAWDGYTIEELNSSEFGLVFRSKIK